MKKNVGSLDKGIRIVIGIVLAAVGVLAPVATGWRVAAFAAGAVAFITAFTGF
jgi:uncharacterized membrane protein (DUF441 family)